MRTERLIEVLVADLSPVRRLVSPTARAAVWAAVAAVCVLLAVVHFGVRHDVDEAWRSGWIVLRVALLAGTAWLAILGCLQLAVPAGEAGVWRRWWPIVGLAALVAVSAGEVAVASMAGPLGSPLRSWTCVRKVAMSGIVPALLSIVLIQRGAPLEPRWTALLGMLAAGAAGAITSEVACPIRAPLHVLLWHTLPVVAITGAGAVLVGAALSWWMRRGRQSAIGNAGDERR